MTWKDKATEKRFVSFDGGVTSTGRLFQPDNATDLTAYAPAPDGDDSTKYISRGAGMSFAAASFGDGITSIDLTRMNHVRELLPKESLCTVEGGVPVGAFLEFLLRQGFYGSIIPGYPTITIGGCIAVDGHGKNQLRDGNFVGQVEKLEIFHPDHGTITAAPSENSELFNLTCGGFGLTGTILSAKLKISRLPSPFMDVVTEPIDDIIQLPGLLTDRASQSDFIISWHDFVQAGARFGTGFVQWGKFSGAASGSSQKNQQSAPDTAPNTAPDKIPDTTGDVVYPIRQEADLSSPLTLTPERRGLSLPPLFGFATTGLMNALYNYSQRMTAGPPRQLPIRACFFPSKILRDLYFHYFGSIGLIEHQAIVPSQNFSTYIERIKWWLERNDLPITIASSKMFKGEQKWLRFNGNGVCFALDFPRCRNGLRFADFLDHLTVEVGAIPNIAKDSRLPQWVVERTFPEYDLFRRSLHDFDPRRRFHSELSQRLGL